MFNTWVGSYEYELHKVKMVQTDDFSNGPWADFLASILSDWQTVKKIFGADTKNGQKRRFFVTKFSSP